MGLRFRKLFWRTWNFLVHEDSLASFIADAILIILIGKFLLFPGIGLILDSDFPVVAVVSSSMDHQAKEIGGGFEGWWSQNSASYAEYNITGNQFEQFYLPNGFEKGDVLVIHGLSPGELEVGDIIVYSTSYRSDPIIHRVVTTDPISTKGDANAGQISFEQNIAENHIHGKAIFIIPYIGWVKVGAMELFSLI